MVAGGAPARRIIGAAFAGMRRYGRAHPRRVGFVAGVLAVVLIAALVLWWPRGGGQRAAAAAVPVAWQRPAVSADALAARVGVTLVRVTVSGDGGLLDLRYKVVDPALALSVHDTTTPPAIVDEKTGLVLHSLLMGHAHEGDLKAAVTYYLVFENTGAWVHRGNEVTVLLGAVQVEHVVVQ